MDFERSASKLEKEREKRRKLALNKKTAELKARAKYDEMEAALAEAAKQQAIVREEEAAKRELEEQRDQTVTRGIKLSKTLQCIPYDAEDDKVIVPPSVLESLTKDNVFANGPIMFQIRMITNSSSPETHRVTHCGVREFTAEEGTIHVPPKVRKSLVTCESDIVSTVEIKYIVLPPVKYVKFQPKLNVFASVEPVKRVLEENLRLHSTLTRGDVVTVWYRGSSFELEAKEILPSDEMYHYGGSLVDADVEVDMDVSKEYAQAHAPPRDTGSSPVTAPPAALHPSNIPTDDNGGMETEVHALLSLPAEPVAGEEGVITCKVSLPGGQAVTRRVLRSSDVTVLFQFVRNIASTSGMDVKDKMLQLSTRFPARKFVENEASAEVSFESVGITSGQEAFFLGFV